MGRLRTEAVRAGLRRLTHDDWIVVAGALLVAVGTRLPWYWSSFSYRGEILQVTVDGWERVGYFGAVASAACCLAALGVLAKAVVRDVEWFDRLVAAVATLAGGVSFLLILWRLFDAPAGVQERRYGIFVALAGALVVAMAGASGLGVGRDAEHPGGAAKDR